MLLQCSQLCLGGFSTVSTTSQTGLQEGSAGGGSAKEHMMAEQGLTGPSFHRAAEENTAWSSSELCRDTA